MMEMDVEEAGEVEGSSGGSNGALQQLPLLARLWGHGGLLLQQWRTCGLLDEHACGNPSLTPFREEEDQSSL